MLNGIETNADIIANLRLVQAQYVEKAQQLSDTNESLQGNIVNWQNQIQDNTNLITSLGEQNQLIEEAIAFIPADNT